MSKSTSSFLLGFSLGALFIIIIFTCSPDPTIPLQQSAVAAGHAEYYLDANNECQWRWKPIKQEEPK